MRGDDARGAGPRRLLLITNQYPIPAGDAVFVASEIDALRAEFDEVHVLNFSPRAESPLPLPPGVHHLGNAYGASRTAKLRALLSWPRLVRALKAIRWRSGRAALMLDVKASVVGMTIAGDRRVRGLLRHPEGSTRVYAFWAMGAGLAVPWLRPDAEAAVVRVHRYDLYEPPGPGLPIRRAVYGSADAVLAISDDGAEYVRSRYPALASDRVRIARLGTTRRGRGAAPGESDPLVLVSCSSVTVIKRVDLILDAAASLAASGRRVRWVHFGDGPRLAQVAAAAERAPGSLEVQLKGQADHESLMEFYRTEGVHVFVNASSSEGVPVSIMEALSFDIPVVATDVGGTGEIVGEELGSGRLVAPDVTADQLAAAIAQVVAQRPRYTPMAVWERLCDAEANARLTAEIVAEVGSPS
ncbi:MULTISPECIES: glycosyltransferase [Microbacterium]|uniref:glycosyltransferase n=1 Tax=Microbacterium TaxID=33882 RepID=UPI00146EE19A|nr:MULTISPECIES: glycosyltransferase [Microbacterium]